MALSARTKPLLHEQPLPLRRSVDIAGAPELVAPAALRARRGRPGSRQRGGNRALHLRRYAELGSIRLLKEELDAQGFTSKRLRSPLGDKPFARGALDLMLQNRIYLGEIVHKERSYPGEHTPTLLREAPRLPGRDWTWYDSPKRHHRRDDALSPGQRKAPGQHLTAARQGDDRETTLNSRRGLFRY
jgi:hypothetical protein